MNLLAKFEAALAERDIYVSMLAPGADDVLVWLVRDRKPAPQDNPLGIHVPCYSDNPEIVVQLGHDEGGRPLITFGGALDPERATPFDLAAAVDVIDGLLPPLPPKAGAS